MNRVPFAVVPLLGVALLAGCRDVIEPFPPTDRPAIDTEPLRLTYSEGDDRSPAWSADSDSIYYSASISDHVANSNGVLVAIGRRGGVTRILLASQPGRAIPRRLVEPAANAADAALAFVELSRGTDPAPCPFDARTCDLRDGVSPNLTEAWLAVGDSADAPDWRRVLHLGFSGTAEPIGLMGAVVLYESRYNPYQEAWLQQRALPFKPAWSPTADRVAVVDHAGLHVVDLATGDSATIATGDVANPAWSPDGASIAFDRVERIDSVTDLCFYQVATSKGIMPSCWERRVYYTTTPPVLWLVNPDGTGATELAPGADPEWSPDGRRLYYVEGGAIVRRDMQTGETLPLAGTEGGAEPAASPDGRSIAFSRYDGVRATRDIWVADLPDDDGE